VIWGRVPGIVFAAISAVVNLAFIAACPRWGIIITLGMFVICALAVHGREMTSG
jgi:hypothetical protein